MNRDPPTSEDKDSGPVAALQDYYQLSDFQRDTLIAIRDVEQSGDPSYGLAIKRQLESKRGEEINHGRLYPNLDELVDMGLVDKSELDKRTNAYTTTDAALAAIEAYRDVLETALR